MNRCILEIGCKMEDGGGGCRKFQGLLNISRLKLAHTSHIIDKLAKVGLNGVPVVVKWMCRWKRDSYGPDFLGG